MRTPSRAQLVAASAGTSKVIQQATSAYFRRWMVKRRDLGDTASEKPGKLFADFTAWSRDSGEAPIFAGEFKEMVERTRGLRYATDKGTQWVRGIAFEKEPPKAEAPGNDEEDEGTAA